MASVRIMKGQPQKVKVFLAPSNFYLILPNYKNHLAGNVDFALFSQLVMNMINYAQSCSNITDADFLMEIMNIEGRQLLKMQMKAL